MRGEREKRVGSGGPLCGDYAECGKSQCRQSRNDNHYDAHHYSPMRLEAEGCTPDLDITVTNKS
jgi:hypothetical protein